MVALGKYINLFYILIIMGLLVKDEILAEISKGNIRIEPFNEKNIGPGSIDLTLDNVFRRFVKKKVVNIDENTDYKKVTKLVRKGVIDIKPGELILGITKEKITLAENIAGWLQGRSRFARLGLMVHVTAGFVQPGVSNKQVLEIINLSPFILKLKSGTRICQIIFEKTEGRAKYSGKFKSQEL